MKDTQFQTEKVIFSHSKKLYSEIMEAVEETKRIASLYELQQDEIVYLQLVTEEACFNAYEYCLKKILIKLKYVGFRVTAA